MDGENYYLIRKSKDEYLIYSSKHKEEMEKELKEGVYREEDIVIVPSQEVMEVIQSGGDLGALWEKYHK